LDVPFGSFSFTSFFLQDALADDVHYIHAFLKLGDVKVAFEIFTRCKCFITFFVLPHTPKVLMPTRLLWVNLHSHFWETLKAMFFGVSEGSPSSSTSLSSHF
jgi:hypothetical protein